MESFYLFVCIIGYKSNCLVKSRLSAIQKMKTKRGRGNTREEKKTIENL